MRIEGRRRRRQLRERRRARSADDQVRRLHLPIHREQERLDPGFEPGAPVAVADHLQIPFSCLVRDRHCEVRRQPAAALPPPWPR